PVVGVLVGIQAPVPVPPSVGAVRLTGQVALFIAVVHRLAEQVGSVLVDVVVAPSVGVAIDGSRVEERIAVVVVAAGQRELLLTPTREVLLLVGVLGQASLLLQYLGTLVGQGLFLLQLLLIESGPLALLLDQLLLACLGEPLLAGLTLLGLGLLLGPRL